MKEISKKTIFLILITLVSLVGIYQTFLSENILKIIKKIESSNTIVAAHRVNIIEKANELKKMGIENIEIDIFSDNGVLMIGHEKETASGKSLEDYFQEIHTLTPNIKFIWLDFKDLTPENELEHIRVLNILDEKYQIKNRALIESRYISALQALSQQDWETAYYLKYNLNEQTDSYIHKVIDELNDNNVNAISFDCVHTEFAIEKFQNIILNNREKIDLNCWTFKRKRYDKLDYNRLHDIKYLLISIKTKNNL